MSLELTSRQIDEARAVVLPPAVAAVRRHEGFRSELYRDSLGYPTIGYGFALHALKPREILSLRISAADDDLLVCPTPDSYRGLTDEQFETLKGQLTCTEERGRIILWDKLKALYGEMVRAHPLIFLREAALQGILINLSYNMGLGWFDKFPKTKELLWSREYDKAAIELADSNWTAQVKWRAIEICCQLTALHQGDLAYPELKDEYFYEFDTHADLYDLRQAVKARWDWTESTYRPKRPEPLTEGA